MEDMDESLHWALERIKIPRDNGRTITDRIEDGTMEVVSDGGLKDNLGTAGGTTKGLPADQGYKFQCRVPGIDDDQTSYQLELCGILGHVLVLTSIADQFNITEGKVTLGCNNKAALWKALGQNTIHTGEPSFDILRVIHHNIKTSPIKWERKHVKGHQDRETKLHDLDPWAQANVEADRLAENMRNRWIARARP